MIKKICKDCDLEKDRNRDHVCVKDLKLALDKERERAKDIQSILDSFLAVNKIKRKSLEEERQSLNT